MRFMRRGNNLEQADSITNTIIILSHVVSYYHHILIVGRIDQKLISYRSYVPLSIAGGAEFSQKNDGR